MGDQNWSASGQAAAELHSQTFFDMTLIIMATGETMTVPVQVCTQITEVRDAIAAKVGYIEPSKIDFIEKRSGGGRVLTQYEQVQHTLYVKGIKSFKVQAYKYDQPVAIIGAGYNGIKLAMFYEVTKAQEYVIFDRYDRVGGHCWLEMANKTTRLQTEFPTYHVWYGPEFKDKCGGAPTKWEIWPTCDRLLEHFQLAADEWGVTPNIRFSTNVETLEMIGKATDLNRYYQLICAPRNYQRKTVQGGGALAHQVGGKNDSRDANGTYSYQGDAIKGKEPYQTNVCAIHMWPGNLCFPRPVHYKGEETFGGMLDFAVEMRCDYTNVIGKNVTIHGHGAFTMENIRTCLEYGVKHIYLLCRKRNLTCPRVVSWFINQANPSISAAHCLNMLEVAYQHIDYNPWDMHSVHANASRTNATFIQKTRFGIGDVYFLAGAYGLMDIIVGEVKRVTYKKVHLTNGNTIECDCILKCTGCLGDWKVDKLLKLKQLVGFWTNGDCRRSVYADPDGISASNFGGTTIGPAAYSYTKLVKHFVDCPNDWLRLEQEGVINMLPVHVAGFPNEEFPGYMIGAKHAVSTSMMVISSSAILSAESAQENQYKHDIQHAAAPKHRILEEAKKDWEQYEKHFREKAMVPADTPYIPYLYTEEYVDEQFRINEIYQQHQQDKTGTEQVVKALLAPIVVPEPVCNDVKETVLSLYGTDETLTVPVYPGWTCSDLRQTLAGYMVADIGEDLSFIYKSDNQYKVLSKESKVPDALTVKGLSSFKATAHQYEHPKGIIGTGYGGLKTAWQYLANGQDDFVMFDRYDRVGGHTWLEMANRTTKLQTEFPTYHIWYGPETSAKGTTRCGGPPHSWEIWPSADRILEHFQVFAEDFGIIAHCRFNTNVESMQIFGSAEPTDVDRFYKLKCLSRRYDRKQTQGGGALAHQTGGAKASTNDKGTYEYEGEVIEGSKPYFTNVCCVHIWPGNLNFPRPVYYPGEDTFGGLIDFGVEMRFDYSNVTGKTVIIHGHGAFTMENIRTCLEHSMKKIWLLCRKRNLTCPRMVSWFINQSNPPAPAAMCLDMLKTAYKYIDYDPWDMHSVNANTNKTFATVIQKTRFGIGDVYFLAAAYGLMEIVVGEVKRAQPGALVLDSGRRVEADCIIKCTGCLGDWKVDRLLQIQSTVGYFINGDPRRTVFADPDGIYASNFGLTTGGPGFPTVAAAITHFVNHPSEFARLEEAGIISMLPVQRAGHPNEEFPAYMYGARHATSSGVVLAGATPYLVVRFGNSDGYKNYIQHLVTPLDRVEKEAREDWEQYERHFRKSGMVPADAPTVPYLYTKDFIKDRLVALADHAAKQAAVAEERRG